MMLLKLSALTQALNVWHV